MARKDLASFSYYFLNKRLHPSPPSGFRSSIILLIINRNSGPNKNKFLFVREITNGYMSWGLPKEGLESKVVVDDIFTAITRNMEEELGFKGIKVTETKPVFYQKAILFDFAVQKYDQARSSYEAFRKRPTKGKIYHLAVMEYHGPEDIPVNPTPVNPEIDSSSWVDLIEGKHLIRESGKTFNQASAEFNEKLLGKVMEIYTDLKKHLESQPSLF